MENLVAYGDILKAAEVIEGVGVRTPLIENHVLSEITAARVFIKPENLQVTGSFKFRGAYNAISSLQENEGVEEIVACSSGNHAQGIAHAAKILGVGATIVMPQDSPLIKLERTRRSGAKVITYDRVSEDRDEIAKDICRQNSAVFVHPFENPLVIAGQGTVGLEICEQVSSLGENVDRVLVCTGGGGLTAGVAISVTHHYPGARIHSVEPEGFDDYRRSLIKNERVANAAKSGSVCDAIITEKPGVNSFAINSKLLDEGLCVSDAQALDAVKFAFHELKLVVEPGGAVALAALLSNAGKWRGETICCVISGGNIDPEMMGQAL